MNNKFWIINAKLETGFEYENNKIIGTKTQIEHLLIEDGKIVNIKIGEAPKDDIPKLNANNLLILPSFVDKHIHLDKGHFGGPWKACTPFVSISDRIEEERGFLKSFLPHTTERAKSLLDLITSYGVTQTRVHCNVDSVIGLANIEKVREVLESYKDKLSYELVAFPQHGLLQNNVVSFMREAMKNGIKIVGGLDPATVDNNIEKSLQTTMELAAEFNADIDIHLHDHGSLGVYTIQRLAQLVEEAKWQGKVNISHAYCLGDISLEKVSELAEILAALKISLTTTSPINVSAPPIPLLHKKGVKIHIVNDNINDHWSPFGTGDLLQRASRMAEKFNWIDEYSLTRALQFITDGIIPLDEKGNRKWPQIGDEASFIFVNSSCSAEAIARISNRKAVMYKGNLTQGSL